MEETIEKFGAINYTDRLIGSNGEVYDYDPPEKLMHSASVEQVARIMGLQQYTLNNTRRIKPPLFSGAVKVTSRYREAEEEPSGSFTSESVATPPGNSSGWPFMKTDLDFSLKPTEVDERAAWAWIRTADLYDQNADRLEQEGNDTEALNLRTERNGQQVLKEIVQRLRMRAMRARRHAQTLSSSARSGDLPIWIKYGDTLSSEDISHYSNLYWRYEDVQRGIVATKYEYASQEFILEALYTYVDEVLEEQGKTHMTANKYVNDIISTEDSLSSVSTLWKLWSNACSWSAELLLPGGNGPRAFRQRVFREMIQRAVDHRAHAEWLVREIAELRMDSMATRKKIEPWRLAHPSTVYLYHNDCMITGFLAVFNGAGCFRYWTAPEDEWRNLYVGAILSHSDYRWDIDTGYGAPGAPDFIYHRLAAREFPETPFSINLLDPPYPQLSSLVAPSATKLERCGAIIADKIFEAWGAFVFSCVKLFKAGLPFDRIMLLIKGEIENLCAQSFYMKEEAQFPIAMCNFIQQYLDTLSPLMSKNPEENMALLWMYMLERGIRWSLPWFDLRLFKTYNYGPDTGRITVQLCSPITGQPVAGRRCCLCTTDIMRLEHARIMRRGFSIDRGDICSGKVLATDTNKKYWDHQLRYREIIESYNWEPAPMFKDYSIHPVPFESERMVYESIRRKMVENWSSDVVWEVDFRQLVEDQQSALDRDSMPMPIEERVLLKNFFDGLENLGMGKRQDLGPWLEKLAQWRKSEKPKPPLEQFKSASDPYFPEGTKLRYWIFRPGGKKPPPEKFLAEVCSALTFE